MKQNLKAIHIIADFFKVKNLPTIKAIETEMVHAANLSKSKILNTSFHHFENTDGVTGVILLSESHISIHTWPEISFVSIDAFMCGNTEPMMAIEYLKEVFVPESTEIKVLERGKLPNDTLKG